MFKINKIGVTDDTLTGRDGMALFVKNLSCVEIYPLLQSLYSMLQYTHILYFKIGNPDYGYLQDSIVRAKLLCFDACLMDL